jgi:transposase
MIPRATRIFVCTRPQDMRVSFDGLALAAKELLGEDPQSGALFCFVGRRANRLKVLWWDRNGYCLLYKRLHRAIFRLPTTSSSTSRIQIDGRELAVLLAGVAHERRRRDGA